MSSSGKAQKNAPRNKGKQASVATRTTVPQSRKFSAAGQPAGSTSSNMLGENRYTPNPTNADPFAPSLAPFPDHPKNHMDNDERSSVSDNDDTAPAVGDKPLPAPGKKTRGRVRIQMEYIQNKLRRYTTFSKRKSGMMKKAYELSTLTGTQVMLLVASETGHVYTFATPKLQPMITSEAGKALIQTCLHQPDPAPMNQGPHQGDFDVRMSSTGYEETDLGYSGLAEEETFKNGMDMHISNAAAMPTIMNPAPIVTIPHGLMQMPFPVSLAETGAPVMTTQPMMHPVQTLTSTPQTMSPHTSPPPSYSPPHQPQPSSPPRTYTPVSYPGSPPTQGPAYSQASVPPHVSHAVMGMEELGSPGHLHHAMDPYERSPSRSPIHSRYSPHMQHSPRTVYAVSNGSPPMPRI